MSDLAVDTLVQRILGLGILDLPHVQEIWQALGTQNVTADEFLFAALRGNQLTKYQVERLRFGETTGFFYGPYKVLYLVGAGTFSRVYRAVHKTTGQVVAVKVLRARFSREPEVIDQFVREAEFAIGLRHPNIVAVYEVASDKDGYYMVMDFVEGQTLREMIRSRKPMECKMATRIMIDVCSGLDFAYNNGFSHHDMKLSNVILASSGKATLIDFGLTTGQGDDAGGKGQRTVDYAALEKVTGVPRGDHRSDIYFAGAIFYNLLAGVSPILETKDRAQRMDRTRFMNVIPLREKNPDVPVLLSAIVEKAMALDADKRYQLPGLMLMDLEAAMQKLESGEGDTTAMLRAAKPAATTQKKTVLVLEADTQLQDVFRETMKKEGYRVLVMSSCERVLERLDDIDHGVDCVIMNAQNIGEDAVKCFNKLTESPTTNELPAILLLDEDQVRWGAQALRNKYRLAVGMPIAMKRLVEVVRRLLETPVQP